MLLHGLGGAARAEAEARLRSCVEDLPARVSTARRRLELVVTRQRQHTLLIDERTWGMARAMDAAPAGVATAGAAPGGIAPHRAHIESVSGTAQRTPGHDPRLCPDGALAIVSRLSCRRGLACSCPARCGFVLGSRQPLTPSTLYSARMRALEEVLELADLPTSSRERAERGARARLLPIVRRVIQTEEAIVAELEREDNEDGGAEDSGGAEVGGGPFGGPFPICFWQFTMSAEEAQARREAEPAYRETGGFVLELEQPRATAFLLIKIGAPENRMQVMGDDHEQPNIDFEFCGGHGWVVHEAMSGEKYGEEIAGDQERVSEQESGASDDDDMDEPGDDDTGENDVAIEGMD